MDWRGYVLRLVLDIARRDGVPPEVICTNYGIPRWVLDLTHNDSHRTRYLRR